MAWNEPGNNGNDKDPWGNRNNSGGPPDLDEFFKNLSDKLGGLFGGKGKKRSGGGGNFPSGPKLSGMAFSVIASLLFIGWLFTGLYVVAPAESGVVTQFGKHIRTTQPGLNWHIPWPVQSVALVNTEERKSTQVDRQLALTKDENLVVIELNVQYRVSNAEDYLFNVRLPDATVQQAAESALREVVGRTEMTPLITTGRDAVGIEIEESVKTILTDYNSGIEIAQVNITYSQPPEEVRGAFEDVIKAREDKERFISESEAYRNEILPRARGDAQRVMEEAEAYKAEVSEASVGESMRFLSLLEEYQKAPQVTRDRLYLESMESVLGNTSKVLVDSESGNNLMYLPLDKLMERQTGRTENNSGSGSGGVSSGAGNIGSGSIDLTRVPSATTTTPNRSTARSRERGTIQ